MHQNTLVYTGQREREKEKKKRENAVHREKEKKIGRDEGRKSNERQKDGGRGMRTKVRWRTVWTVRKRKLLIKE